MQTLLDCPRRQEEETGSEISVQTDPLFQKSLPFCDRASTEGIDKDIGFQAFVKQGC